MRPLQTYFAARGCTGTASQAEEWMVNAVVDTAFREMKLQWNFTTSEKTGRVVCMTGGHRSEHPLYPSIFGGLSQEPLLIPLDSDTAAKLTRKHGTGRAQEWISIKVVGTPRG